MAAAAHHQQSRRRNGRRQACAQHRNGEIIRRRRGESIKAGENVIMKNESGVAANKAISVTASEEMIISIETS